MAELAQLKVELAKALEAQTGSQSEQTNLAQRTSELVRTYTTEIMGHAKGATFFLTDLLMFQAFKVQ